MPFAEQPWSWRFWSVLLFALAGFVGLTITHTLLSIITVAGGWSEPDRWPPLFGRWGDAYTIRKFWGYESGPSFSVVLLTNLCLDECGINCCGG